MSEIGSFHFDVPDVFTVGTVGEVGRRAFFLQVGQDGVMVTLKLEKQQVAALADHLDRMLASSRPLSMEAGVLPDLTEAEPDWVVGQIGISSDEKAGRVILVVESLASDDDGEPNRGMIELSMAQVESFIVRGRELVASGRPPCQLCGLPLDPRGHSCPRQNGHRPPIV
jgi:uncharacterized repeat protein (TIGR03847 family)